MKVYRPEKSSTYVLVESEKAPQKNEISSESRINELFQEKKCRLRTAAIYSQNSS